MPELAAGVKPNNCFFFLFFFLPILSLLGYPQREDVSPILTGVEDCCGIISRVIG
jgi:hypothetical protein